MPEQHAGTRRRPRRTAGLRSLRQRRLVGRRRTWQGILATEPRPAVHSARGQVAGTAAAPRRCATADRPARHQIRRRESRRRPAPARGSRSPAAMTRPPSQAPSALAMLSEAWFIAAPRVCGVAGDVHQPQLQVDDQHRADRRHQERDGQQPPAVRRERTRTAEQDHAEPTAGAEQRPEDRPVGQLARPARCRRPCRAPNASRKTGTGRLGQAADLGDGRGDVGVDREHAAEADRAGQQRQPDLRLARRAASSRRPVASGSPGQRGHERRATSATVSRASTATRPGTPPASRACWPSQVAARHADDVGDRQARASRSRPRGPGAPAATRLAATSDGDAEVGAVRQPVEEPGHHQQP